MKMAVIELKWHECFRNILNWRNKRRNDQFDKVNLGRERSIRILQQRYGYTREQATYQLERHYSRARLG